MLKFLRGSGFSIRSFCIAFSIFFASLFVACSTLAQNDGAVSNPGRFGLGRLALEEEVAAWNTDIRPDGMGLPVGRGDVFTGEEIYIDNCAMCHGDFGEAVGRWPVLAGGEGTLNEDRPVKTTGSYWPYLSTIYDYVQRAMPFGNSRSLSTDDVYALTAYILYLNDLADEDFELSNENFTDVQMPNAVNFFMDDRDVTEIPQFSRDVCMQDCKEQVEITMHARVLDVTPDSENSEASDSDVSANDVSAQIEETAIVDVENKVLLDPELVAAGETVFRKCRACHQVGEDAVNRTGPVLNGVFGREAGVVEGFRYSDALQEAAENGLIWDQGNLGQFLAKPRAFLRGTRMSFGGLRKEADIIALLEYLKSFDE